MKSQHIFAPAAVLALAAVASTSFAAERVRHPHHLCKGNEPEKLSATIGSATFVAADTAHCPLLRFSADSSYSDIDMRTSLGLSAGEVTLREVNETGSLVASHVPSTTPIGSTNNHDWDNIDPLGDTQLSIQLVGATNDQVFSYSYTDDLLNF